MSVSSALAGSWNALPDPLTPWVLDVIQFMGHSRMTPVQASTIPLFLKHKDVVVEAVTGSGKTLAFVIPVLERLIRRESKFRREEVGVLIISPTRELATQIHSVFSFFLSSQPNNALALPPPLLIVSSEQSSPVNDVERFLSIGADIVIGTPGRIEEFLLGKGRGSVNVKELEVLVMDEADKLLDLGFQNALTRIISCLPKQRRTGLFSATMTDADSLSELVRVGLRNPARIIVKVQLKKVRSNSGKIEDQIIEEQRVPASLQNFYITCQASEKLLQLTRIISHEISKMKPNFIVYFSTCACVDYFFKILPRLLDHPVTFYSLHGNLSPNTRTRTLSAFSFAITSPSRPSILLATDVAARGLDLPTVDVVIQFDPPNDTKAFSHRCGRTARAGRTGTAWILLAGREVEFCDFLSIRKIPLKKHPYLLPDGLSQDISGLSEDTAVNLLLDQVRNILRIDRSLHDRSVKAFVSFVRAYSKHEASYIFRVKDLDLVGVAKSFGLLRLPKMPELKSVNNDTWNDADVDWDNYKYVDEPQEAKRLKEAKLRREKHQDCSDLAAKGKKSDSWSTKMANKEERAKRRDRKKLKKEWVKSQHVASQVTEERNGKRRRGVSSGEDEEERRNEWEELAQEEKMAKKARKGNMSMMAFHNFLES